MDELLLHPRTRAELRALLTDAPHGLLLVAPPGTGKRAVAEAWAHQLPNAEVTLLEPDEKGTITIGATRILYQRTRAKQAGHQVVIIDHAEAMSTEAQNAFLKLLEEPRPRLTFILTAPHAEDMLPTITSRVQTLALHALGTHALSERAKAINPQLDTQTLAQLLFVAQGRPALLVTMARDPAAFTQYKTAMQRAKQLVGSTRYERLAMVQDLTKDKTELTVVLEAMTHMVKLQLQREPHTPKWQQLAEALQVCLTRLRQNGNPRAQLVHLFLAY